MGPFQPMNFCTPPILATSSVPGRKYRWYVFARMICACISRRSRVESPFTLARVPTGIKIGVSTTPWAVWSRPRRALLLSLVLTSSKGLLFTGLKIDNRKTCAVFLNDIGVCFGVTEYLFAEPFL